MPILSVVIVTYNSGKIVLDTLQSVVNSQTNFDVEIIIVDNQSQDGTSAQILTRFPQARLIVNPDNLGFAAANNIGLKAASGDFLLLLNPDVIVEAEALQQMIDYLKGEPMVGIAGPRTTTGQGEVAVTAHGAYTPLVILWQFWGMESLFPYYVSEKYRRQCEQVVMPFECEWIQASCLIMRRQVYDQIGGLDSGLFMFSEEPDFCERGAQAGWRTMFLPQARVTHYESTTISRYPLLKMRHYHLSPLHYFRKRRQPIAVLALKLGFIAELGLKYLVRKLQMALRPQSQFEAKLEAYPKVMREVWNYSITAGASVE